jgi:hypothetical protein
VICYFRCGKTSQQTHLWAPAREPGQLKHAHPPARITVFGGERAHHHSSHGNKVHCSHMGLDLGARAAKLQSAGYGGIGVPLTGQNARPGEDSTGAGAEREGGFDPQSKAELAQGEYKGARGVRARHVHTAQPWGGPGGC